MLQLMQDNHRYPIGKIRSSLTESARVLTQHCTTFAQILHELDVVYLLPEDPTKMQKDLFTSKQQAGESTQEFYVRMESLRHQLSKVKPELASILDGESRTLFWQGLRDSPVKAALHFKFDAGVNTPQLLQAVLAYEAQQQHVTVKSARSQPQLTEKFQRACNIRMEPASMKKNVHFDEDDDERVVTRKCKECGKLGHGRATCWRLQKPNRGGYNSGYRHQSNQQPTARQNDNAYAAPLNGQAPSSRGRRR